MKTTALHSKPPKILPWLARKAGITERRAEVLWHAAQRHAALRTGENETPAYWKASMDRLLELIAAETLREDAASFGWRRWARLNAQFWQAPVALLDAAALSSSRGWRVFGQAVRPCC
ncbi:MAG: hypothetical protein OEL88_01440 [Sterolibacteriaceae bacterium MAG5]|nr:hypothetical protein [Candidatus Nitricoxidireducens bremensis]